MSRGRISCAVHTEGLVAGTCRDFVFWLVYFPKCRGDMSHEQFTRGDLAFNRGVTLFCRRDMSPQFKLIWIQGTCRGDKISSLRQDFLWKSSVHTMGFVAGTKSPRPVPATCPLVWADLKARLHMRFSMRFWCDFDANLSTNLAQAYPARVYSRVKLQQNTAKLAEIRKNGVFK